jgi:hypothetical protein
LARDGDTWLSWAAKLLRKTEMWYSPYQILRSPLIFSIVSEPKIRLCC